MKPLLYLRERSLPVLALVGAYQKVMGSKPVKRAKPARQKKLPLFEKEARDAAKG